MGSLWLAGMLPYPTLGPSLAQGRERERAHVRGPKIGLAGADVVPEAALVLGQR